MSAVRTFAVHLTIPDNEAFTALETLARLGVPVDRVGLYVPGGNAVYPSSVVMNVVPAQAAGVSPMRSTASSTTRLSTVVASWAFSVWVSSSIGACKSRRARSRSAAADASSTTSHEG